MEHFPELDPNNASCSLLTVSMKSDSRPSIEIPFEVHPDHTIESIARFSRSRPRGYCLIFNDCRTHSFEVIKHAMMPPPQGHIISRPSYSEQGRCFDFWRFGNT